MAGKGLDAGRSYWQGVLAKITDPDARAAAERLMANETVMTEIGGGVLAQSEVDRQLQALRAQQTDLQAKEQEITARDQQLDNWQQQLTDWRGSKLADLQELQDWRTGKKTPAGGPPTGQSAKLPDNVLTTEAFDARLQEERAAFLGFNVERDEIAKEHFEKFGKFIDVKPLLTHPKIRELGLKGVYAEVHKDALAAHAQQQEAAKEAAIREKVRAELLASGVGSPYPVTSGPGSGSPLDALQATRTDNVLVDQAATEYQRLQAARAGA